MNQINPVLEKVLNCLQETEQELCCYHMLIEQAESRIRFPFTLPEEREHFKRAMSAWYNNYRNILKYVYDTIHDAEKALKSQGNLRCLELVKLERKTFKYLRQFYLITH